MLPLIGFWKKRKLFGLSTCSECLSSCRYPCAVCRFCFNPCWKVLTSHLRSTLTYCSRCFLCLKMTSVRDSHVQKYPAFHNGSTSLQKPSWLKGQQNPNNVTICCLESVVGTLVASIHSTPTMTLHLCLGDSEEKPLSTLSELKTLQVKISDSEIICIYILYFFLIYI